MSNVRSTLIFSITFVLSVAMVVLFVHYKERFMMMSQGPGIFIFDRKMNSLSFCDGNGCRLVSVQGEQMASIQPAMGSAPQQFPQMQQLGFVNPTQMQQAAQAQAGYAVAAQPATVNPQALAALQTQQAQQIQQTQPSASQQQALAQAALYRQQQIAAAARLQPVVAQRPVAAAPASAVAVAPKVASKPAPKPAAEEEEEEEEEEETTEKAAKAEKSAKADE